MPTRTCSVEGCGQVRKARGLCLKHYKADYYQRNKAVLDARQRQWVTDNRAKVREKSNRYYQRHREQCLSATRDWQRRNAERLTEERRKRYWRERDRWRAYDKKWREANPEKHNEKERRRRARKRGVLTIPFTAEQLAQRMAYYGDRCWMCGGPFEHIDHVKPLAADGPHILANLRPACRPCNLAKRDKWGPP